VVRTPQSDAAPWRRDRWEALRSRRDCTGAAAASVTIGGSGITAYGADWTSERRAQRTEGIDRPVRGGERAGAVGLVDKGGDVDVPTFHRMTWWSVFLSLSRLNMGCHGVKRPRKLCRAQQSSITRSRIPAFQRRIRSFTIRQRLTLLWTCSIRKRRSWRAWFAHCSSNGISFEAANLRHAHEWQLFELVQLPQDKVLIPGVIELTGCKFF
jgi:hypothetical protein